MLDRAEHFLGARHHGGTSMPRTGDIQDALLGHLSGTTGADTYVRRVNVEMAHLTRVMKAPSAPIRSALLLRLFTAAAMQVSALRSGIGGFVSLFWISRSCSAFPRRSRQQFPLRVVPSLQ